MFGFKSVVAVAAVATMIGSSAFAANVSLVPGKPAGVEKAQNVGNGTIIIGLGAAPANLPYGSVALNQESPLPLGWRAFCFPGCSQMLSTPALILASFNGFLPGLVR
jgi:hypothetical protein